MHFDLLTTTLTHTHETFILNCGFINLSFHFLTYQNVYNNSCGESHRIRSWYVSQLIEQAAGDGCGQYFRVRFVCLPKTFHHQFRECSRVFGFWQTILPLFHLLLANVTARVLSFPNMLSNRLSFNKLLFPSRFARMVCQRYKHTHTHLMKSEFIIISESVCVWLSSSNILTFATTD